MVGEATQLLKSLWVGEHDAGFEAKDGRLTHMFEMADSAQAE
jgi:hypothetical protein